MTSATELAVDSSAADRPAQPTEPGEPTQAQSGPVRAAVWVVLTVAIAMIAGAWALATPYGATPDERSHVYHAAGSAGGDFFPNPSAAKYGTGAVYGIPQGLVRQCTVGGIADFCPGRSDAHTIVPAPSYTGRYNSVYYAVVGWPLRLWPDATGLLIARLLSVLLVAVTLAAAVYCAARWSRRRVVIPALIAAGTPMLFHIAGAVNPNGLEIAAGTLLFCALIPLGDSAQPVQPACVRLAALAGCLLMTLRALGPLWFVIGTLVVLLGASRARLRALIGFPTVRRWGIAVAIVGLAGVAWTLVFHAAAGAVVATQHVSASAAVKQMLLSNWSALLVQMVGDLGYLSTSLPGIVIFTWAAVIGFLVLGAAVLGTRSARIRLLALVLACLAIPTASVVASVNTLDFFWQGRYSLPLAVGLPIVAAYELSIVDILNERTIRRLTWLLAVVLLPTQLVALWLMMIRWQNNMVPLGIHFPVNPLQSTGWRPPHGPLPPIVVMVVGLIMLGWVYLRLVRRVKPRP